MNAHVEVDDTTRRALAGYGIDLEGFAARAIRAHLRQCEDAAVVLATRPAGAAERPMDRWARELAAREPAVMQMLESRKSKGDKGNDRR